MANPATTSDYLYVKQMDHLLNGDAFTSPYDTIYVALLTTVGSLDGIGQVEVGTGKGYARVQVPEEGWTGPGSSPNLEYNNTAAITFGAPSQNWGEVKGAALYDSGTNGAGNLLFLATLTTSKTISANDGAPKILANMLKITRASCS